MGSVSTGVRLYARLVISPVLGLARIKEFARCPAVLLALDCPAIAAVKKRFPVDISAPLCAVSCVHQPNTVSSARVIPAP